MAPADHTLILDLKDIIRKFRLETDHDMQNAWINWLDQRLDLEASKNQTRFEFCALLQDLDRRQIDIEFFEHRDSVFPHPYIMQFVLTLRVNRILKKHYMGVADTSLGSIAEALWQLRRDPQLLASRVVGSPLGSPLGSPTVTCAAQQTWAQKASM